MRSTVAALLLAVGGAGISEPAAAQLPVQFAIEGRGAFATPFGLWNINNDIGNGYGGGGNVQVWLSNRLGVLAGWETLKFSVDRPDLEGGVKSHAIDRGFRFGVMTPYPLIFSGTGALLLYAGGIFNETSFVIHDNRESIAVTSNNEIGYEAGTTLHIPFGNIYMFTPALRYRGHKAVFGPATESGPNETDLEYLVVDFGVRMNLGPRPTLRGGEPR